MLPSSFLSPPSRSQSHQLSHEFFHLDDFDNLSSPSFDSLPPSSPSPPTRPSLLLTPTSGMSEIIPFPRAFPPEVLLLIFDSLDSSTLAVLGRVSIGVLRVTTPRLYRDVVVRSVEQLEGLFCEREEEGNEQSSIPSRINHLLSPCQIKNLFIDFSTLPSPSSIHPFLISDSRIEGPYPIPLDCLRISLQDRSRELLSLLHSSLLPHLDPARLEYNVSTSVSSCRGTTPFDAPTPILERWTRLKVLDLKGILPFSRARPSHWSNTGVDAVRLVRTRPHEPTNQRRITP
ncbi:hypothetical protein BDY24DRAFT_415110 [Mrakia frigida]|uniref:uncharacterized protein n=1 Tax=Mrakia frigida TaxID=29902 RepID=UPI003FCC11E6